MSVLVSGVLFYTMTNTVLWDLPGDVLAAPASALCGWKGVNSLSLSLYTATLAPGSHCTLHWFPAVLRLVNFSLPCGFTTIMQSKHGFF